MASAIAGSTPVHYHTMLAPLAANEGLPVGPVIGMDAPTGQGAAVTLTKPVNVQVSSDAPGEMTLTWEGTDAPNGFLLMAMILETSASETAFVTDGAARTGTVTGLTGGVSYVGVVVALEVTEGGFDYLYDWGGPVTVQSGARVESSADKAVLVALYNATGGVNWTDNTNWLSDAPCWGVARRDHRRHRPRH